VKLSPADSSGPPSWPTHPGEWPNDREEAEEGRRGSLRGTDRDLGIPETHPHAHTAGDAFQPQPADGKEFLDSIMDDPRMHDHLDGFESCIQCGICTSACPAARFTEYSPRKTARRALEGDDSLLTDDSVWYCYYCYTCQSRFPRHNSVAVINQVLRGMQVESGVGVKHVEMFAR